MADAGNWFYCLTSNTQPTHIISLARAHARTQTHSTVYNLSFYLPGLESMCDVCAQVWVSLSMSSPAYPEIPIKCVMQCIKQDIHELKSIIYQILTWFLIADSINNTIRISNKFLRVSRPRNALFIH